MRTFGTLSAVRKTSICGFFARRIGIPLVELRLSIRWSLGSLQMHFQRSKDIDGSLQVPSA